MVEPSNNLWHQLGRECPDETQVADEDVRIFGDLEGDCPLHA